MLLLLLMSITIAPRSPSRGQTFPAHHPSAVSAACLRSTGYSYLVKEKKVCRKSGLLVLQKGDGSTKRSSNSCKVTQGVQTELGTVMLLSFIPVSILPTK